MRSKSRSRSKSRDQSRSRSRSRSRERNDAKNPGNTLFVTGLSTRVSERDLEDHFSKEGKVVDCRLVVEPYTRASRGFAFVTMDNVDDAERCIKHLDQSILEGRYITVEKKTLLQLSWQQDKDDEFIHLKSQLKRHSLTNCQPNIKANAPEPRHLEAISGINETGILVIDLNPVDIEEDMNVMNIMVLVVTDAPL